MWKILTWTILCVTLPRMYTETHKQATDGAGRQICICGVLVEQCSGVPPEAHMAATDGSGCVAILLWLQELAPLPQQPA